MKTFKPFVQCLLCVLTLLLLCSGGLSHAEDEVPADVTVISYDSNGGEGEIASDTVSITSNYVPKEGFSRTGYFFTGYSTRTKGRGDILIPGQEYPAPYYIKGNLLKETGNLPSGRSIGGQGAVFYQKDDRTYLLKVYIKENDTTQQSDTNYWEIVKYDITDPENIVAVQSLNDTTSLLHVGHGNAVAYNPDRDVFYISTMRRLFYGEGENVVLEISEDLSTVTEETAVYHEVYRNSAITWSDGIIYANTKDEDGDRYINMYDNDWNLLGSFYIYDAYFKTAQSFFIKDDYLIYIGTNNLSGSIAETVLAYYDKKDGTFIKKQRMINDLEIEAVSWLDGQLYGSDYRKKKTGIYLIDTSQFATLYAIWKPITYTIRLDANTPHPTNEEVSFKATYDSPIVLPVNSYQREGWMFVGYNSEPDGSGIAYEEGDQVVNLTATDQDEAVIYAQWAFKQELITEITNSFNTKNSKTTTAWTNIEAADSYRVYRATSLNGPYKLLAEVTEPSYKNKISKGKNYFYKVQAMYHDEDGNPVEGLFSDVQGYYVFKSSVSLKAKGAKGKATLTIKKVSGTTKYLIYRSTKKNGTYTLIGSTASLKYVDKVKKGTYYYKVRPVHVFEGFEKYGKYSSIIKVKVK